MIHLLLKRKIVKNLRSIRANIPFQIMKLILRSVLPFAFHYITLAELYQSKISTKIKLIL